MKQRVHGAGRTAGELSEKSLNLVTPMVLPPNDDMLSIHLTTIEY